MAAGYVSIGERIAILRRRRGMTQAVLAGRLGKSVQWLSNIERGVRSVGRALLGRCVGDEVRFWAPGGVLAVTVVGVERPVEA